MADVSGAEDSSVIVESPILDSRRRGKTCDFRLYNIIILGISFMLIFSAFQTSCIVEQIVIKSAENEVNSTFHGSGYASLSIIYAVFSVCNWLAPSIIALMGLKTTMIVGGAMYCLFIFSFMRLMEWALYLGSVLVGFGAAIIWTAQGSFLTINSDPETVARNSGIFWALFQCSLLFGNIYTYFTLHHNDQASHNQSISSHERITLYAGLTGACVVGVITFFALRTKSLLAGHGSVNTSALSSVPADSPLSALKKSFRLFLTKEMLVLTVNFAYTGFELTFWSGVYGTCVGNTRDFRPDAAALVGIVGIFIGLGEILGGAMFGLFGKRTIRHGRDPVIMLGYCIHMITFFIIFMNLHDYSPISADYDDKTYMPSNKYVAVLCGFLLGLGDASFNTQIYTILASMYPHDSSPAFALFKFVQSVAAAIAFAYSIELLLKWQLLILVVMGTAGTLAYFKVEWTQRNQYEPLPSIVDSH